MISVLSSCGVPNVVRRRAWRVGLLATIGCLTACGWMDVSDPTLVQDSNIASEGGANSRRGAVVVVANAFGQVAHNVAYFTDERTLDSQYPQYRYGPAWLDQRDLTHFESTYGNSDDPHLGYLQEIVTKSSLAIYSVRAYMPDSLRREYLTQLFALRGFAVVQMAEDICPGFPINDVTETNLPVFGEPRTTDEALAYGVAQLDSALAHGQDTARFLHLARIVRGRALLDLGQYAAAAAAVTAVPTGFTYQTDTWYNYGLYSENSFYGNAEAVGERKGGNGLPFVSAHDPRVVTLYKQPRYNDPTDSLYDQQKYVAYDSPVVLASGIEARLIEAEAALAAGDPNWLAILNTLRTSAISPAMATIDTMPSTPEAKVDLVYRERAFWLYLTGRRLGDMRRLIRNYARTPDTVFPMGAYPLGGAYGLATAIPFILANQKQFNPHITEGCSTP